MKRFVLKQHRKNNIFRGVMGLKISLFQGSRLSQLEDEVNEFIENEDGIEVMDVQTTYSEEGLVITLVYK